LTKIEEPEVAMLTAIHHALYLQCCEIIQRAPSPTACIIGSQSVKSTEKGGRNVDPNGYDAGKKIKGKKSHILVYTVGLVLHAIVHPADFRERDGGILLISTLFGRFPFLRKLFTDGGYQGPQFEQAIASVYPQLDVELIKRSDAAGGFKVLPRPVGDAAKGSTPGSAWNGRGGRRADYRLAQSLPSLCKDFEKLTRNAMAILRLASIRLMLRKLCNP
jgi:hypothetical protein